MTQPTIIYKTALAVFKDKKMIMVRNDRNEEVFYTLGGRIEEGETGLECLIREIHEEVDAKMDEKTVKFLKEFQAPAHGRENTFVNIRLYEGELIGEPKPSTEIVEIAYFDSSVDRKHLTAITLDIFDWLKKNSYIN